MRNKILQLIASSKNSDELADRICELVEEEKQDLVNKCDTLVGYINRPVGLSIEEGIKEEWEIYLKEHDSAFHPTPEAYRRDVEKGK